MFIKPGLNDIVAIKTILQIFGDVSGLYTNLGKCVANPIACSQEELQLVENMLSCTIGAFLCKYLGIPISTRRLRWTEEQFLIDTVAACIPL